MAVEHAQRPGAQRQKARHRKRDAEHGDRERKAVDLGLARGDRRGVLQKARRDHRHGRLGEDDAQEGRQRHGRRHESEHGAGEAAGVALAPLLQHPAVDGDKAGRQRALAEQVVEQVRPAHDELEHVQVRPDAEVVGDGLLAHEPHDAARQDARGHEGGGRARPGPLAPGGVRVGGLLGRRARRGVGLLERRGAAARRAQAAGLQGVLGRGLVLRLGDRLRRRRLARSVGASGAPRLVAWLGHASPSVCPIGWCERWSTASR